VPQIARRPKAEDEGKVTLARDIQRELKRVGCYSGDADGTWNTSTKQAMKSFIDRVNATLPTDEPDHILKTLVQGHPGNACGKSCPSGQTAASDGRCLPTGVMTQAPAKKAAPVETASIQAPKPSAPAVSEPVAKVPQAAQPKAAAASSWETTTTTVAPPAMAAIAAVSAASTAASDSKPTAPLPGRMAVGAADGPAPAPPSVTQAPVTQPSEPQSADTAPASKPKAVVVKAKARSEPSEKSEKPEKAEKPDPVEKAEKPSRPPVAAVTAAETPTPRRSAPAPAPRVAAYRSPPPPPRYVGVYSPPARERPRFGPSIFRQMESNGR
jgi:hypothetical protein